MVAPSYAHWPLVLLTSDPVRAPASAAQPPSGGGLGEGPGPTRSVGGGPLRCLSLPLLVAGVAADDPHHAPAFDDLALLAPHLHRRSHLHTLIGLSSY